LILQKAKFYPAIKIRMTTFPVIEKLFLVAPLGL